MDLTAISHSEGKSTRETVYDHDGTRIRAYVKQDSYDFQRRASLDIWIDGQGWERLFSIQDGELIGSRPGSGPAMWETEDNLMKRYAAWAGVKFNRFDTEASLHLGGYLECDGGRGICACGRSS